VTGRLADQGAALGWRIGLVAIALWLGHQAWTRNLDQACRLGEWPYLERCTEIRAQPPAELARTLQDRLRHNPGDAWAAVQLAELAHEHPREVSLDPGLALQTAQQLAPQHTRVLTLLANRAIAAKQWSQAVPHLTRLATHHRNASAATSLAQMIGVAATDPALQSALLQASTDTPRWLQPVIPRMPGAKVPLVLAMPYVSQSMAEDGLDMPTSRLLIRQLKAEGQWLDAYNVWLHLWKRPVDLLFNGDFEQAFLPGGFDWEPGQTQAFRAGAQVQRSGRGNRGQVLEVVFTGKAMAPQVVRQDVLLSPGRYLLEGEYLASELRTAQGLVWAVRCARDGREVARSAAMLPDGRNWRTWRLEFEFPAECGLGGTLELKPQAAFESVAGMKGEALFDRLRLERL
jgi:hypothetical protein